jgi:hypothetical protein
MQVVVDKTPTTPRDLGQGVLEAIKKIEVGMSQVALFIHGTTAGLNTIAQRKGARVGMITTRGFTDILELVIGSQYFIICLSLGFAACHCNSKGIVIKYQKNQCRGRKTHGKSIFLKD